MNVRGCRRQPLHEEALVLQRDAKLLRGGDVPQRRGVCCYALASIMEWGWATQRLELYPGVVPHSVIGNHYRIYELFWKNIYCVGASCQYLLREVKEHGREAPESL